jgi:uncharacterized protein (TIGR00251 family)
MKLRADGTGWCIDVLVQPRASRDRIGPLQGDRLKVAVTAPPVDNQANAAVVDVVARALGVPRRQVAVVAGATSRRKTLRVDGVDRAALAALSVKPT